LYKSYKFPKETERIKVVGNAVLLSGKNVRLNDLETGSNIRIYQYGDYTQYSGLTIDESDVYAANYYRVVCWDFHTGDLRNVYTDPQTVSSGYACTAVSENYVFKSSEYNIVQFNKKTASVIRILVGTLTSSITYNQAILTMS
jgi:hypothetical protein